jgi:uncharacterized protein (TIGR02594 family)
VQRLQKLLNWALRLDPPLVMDGNFSPATEAALKSYQVSIGRRCDGITVEDVLAALKKLLLPWRRAGIPATRGKEPPWVAIARKEQGQIEIPGPEHNPRIIEYHAATTLRASSDETAWCSSFVNWCMQRAGITGTRSATAASWIHWGKACCAKPGAITIIYNCRAAGSKLTPSGYHVAFLTQETASHLHLLGGNQKDMVRISHYPKSSWQVKGYRWPTTN